MSCAACAGKRHRRVSGPPLSGSSSAWRARAPARCASRKSAGITRFGGRSASPRRPGGRPACGAPGDAAWVRRASEPLLPGQPLMSCRHGAGACERCFRSRRRRTWSPRSARRTPPAQLSSWLTMTRRIRGWCSARRSRTWSSGSRLGSSRSRTPVPRSSGPASSGRPWRPWAPRLGAGARHSRARSCRPVSRPQWRTSV